MRRIRHTSHGIELPRTADGRTIAARRFQHLVEAYSRELGGELSPAEKSLITQAATLQMEAEQLQEAIVRGETIDSDRLIRLSGTSRRLLQIIASKSGKREAPAAQTVADIFAVHDDADAEEAGAE
jgi:hypothetical protein